MKRPLAFIIPLLLMLAACTEFDAPVGNIVLDSASELILNNEEQELNVTVSLPAGYKYVNAMPEVQAKDWLELVSITKGRDADQAVITFLVRENTTEQVRESSITIGSTRSPMQVQVFIKQRPEIYIDVPSASYEAFFMGERLRIPVESNTPYELTYEDESAKEWLQYQYTDGQNNIVFLAAENPAEQERIATLHLVQTEPTTGQEPISVIFTVTQGKRETLVHLAADMSVGFLFPKFQYIDPRWNLDQGTVEMLINIKGFPDNFRAYIFNGDFDLGFGKQYVSNTSEYLYLNYKSYDGYKEIKIDRKFEAGKWYHVAMTWARKRLMVYIDGQCVVDVDNYQQDRENREWLFGYSPFNGLMTEIRAWSIPLSAEQLNEPGHFYNVDPDKYGYDLYGNWKMVEESASTIYNLVNFDMNKEPLYGGINPYKGNYEPGIVWVEVSLPE